MKKFFIKSNDLVDDITYFTVIDNIMWSYFINLYL